MLDDPTGYGRIVRNARGAIQKIVEQKDASRAQLQDPRGQQRHPGRAGQTTAHAGWRRLRNANAQGEYYLTDVIAMAVKEQASRSRR